MVKFLLGLLFGKLVQISLNKDARLAVHTCENCINLLKGDKLITCRADR